MSAQPGARFDFFGFVTLPGTVLDFAWCSSPKPPIDLKTSSHLVEVILKNGLLVCVVPPMRPSSVPVFKEFPLDDVSLRARRIDFDISVVSVCNETGDVLCTGDEKVIRRYKQPEDLLRDMDLRARPPFTPVEMDGHDLKTTCMSYVEGIGSFVSGGQDGAVIRRSSKEGGVVESVKAQNYVGGGVSACAASRKYPLLIAGGFDGCLLVFSLEQFEFEKDRSREREVPSDLDASVARGVDSKSDADVKYYEMVLEEEMHRAKENERFETQKNMKEKLYVIKQKLKRLIDQNRRAEEIDKIERDEFCLDLELRTKMLTDGEKGVEAIRKEAYTKNLRQELMHKKIMMNTYSKVDTHLKTVTGLVENTLVFNFVVRKREKMETEKYRMFGNLRQVELTEKKWRKENGLEEIVDLNAIIGAPSKQDKKRELEMQEFLQTCVDSKFIISRPENFIYCLKQGKQKYLLLDHAKREEERQRIKAAALEYDHKGDNQDLNQEAQDRPDPSGYRLYRLGRNPRGKKKHPGALLNKDDIIEEGNEDQTDNEANDDDEDKVGWDLLYGAFDLFTTKRKKSQIVFLKNIIFKIKKSFNKEFEVFFKYRFKEIEKINDLNTLIQEQLEKLKKDEQNFKPNPNIIEK